MEGHIGKAIEGLRLTQSPKDQEWASVLEQILRERGKDIQIAERSQSPVQIFPDVNFFLKKNNESLFTPELALEFGRMLAGIDDNTSLPSLKYWDLKKRKHPWQYDLGLPPLQWVEWMETQNIHTRSVLSRSLSIAQSRLHYIFHKGTQPSLGSPVTVGELLNTDNYLSQVNPREMGLTFAFIIQAAHNANSFRNEGQSNYQ